MTKARFAVFDIDGTLIRWQLYHAVVDKLAKKGLLGDEAHDRLHDARMIWKRREQPDAFKAYERTLITVYESALDTLSAAIFDATVNEVIEEYKDQSYTYTRRLLRRLKSEGYVLLAISGSHHELVEEIAKHYKFDDWVGTKYGRHDDTFSGEKILASSDKKSVLESLIEKHQLGLEDSIAIGDSASDIAMLEVVEQPIAFNPDSILFAKAQQEHWKIIVERKDIIYELEPSNGQYLLAPTGK